MFFQSGHTSRTQGKVREGEAILLEKPGEFMKNCQSERKVGGKWKLFANILENVDIAGFISVFCLRIRVINVTFCYTSDKLESGKIFKNLKSMATLFSLCCWQYRSYFSSDADDQLIVFYYSSPEIWLYKSDMLDLYVIPQDKIKNILNV